MTDGLGEQLRNIDTRVHRDATATRTQFDEIERRFEKVEERNKSHSDRLDAVELRASEGRGEIKAEFAALNVKVTMLIWVVATVALATIGNVVSLWFRL